MTYIQTWDETVPAGTRALNLGDDDIRAFKVAIRERLAGGGMHFPSTDDANAGLFNNVKFIEASANPTVEANRGFLFTKDVSGVTELYWMDSSGNVMQLTSGGAFLITNLSISGQTRGDLIARAASAWARLAIGASGRFLRSDGTDPSWSLIQSGDIDYTNLPSGSVLQHVITTNATAYSKSTQNIVADDDTIPQITEGFEVLSRAITPKQTGNKLIIRAVVFLGGSTAGDRVVACLHKSGTNDALMVAAGDSLSYSVSEQEQLVLQYEQTAAGTSEEVYSIRVGHGDNNTMYINQNNSSRDYGAKITSSISIMEIKA